MGSVIFDFDSTLVPCESLEELARRGPALSAAKIAEIERLTAAGMEGAISFEDSLRQRLRILRPTRQAAVQLGRRLAAEPTRGARELVADLRAEGHDVWIVSGGFRDVLLEMGAVLGLPEERVLGVSCIWEPDGVLRDVDWTSGFAQSKAEGLRRLATPFEAPSIGVGDGATDLALREAGYVRYFVAYSEHARRPGVVASADFEAANMRALERILGTLLG